MNLSSKKLFPVSPVIHFINERQTCPACNQILTVEKTRTKRASTLVIGDFVAHETLGRCDGCRCSFGSKELLFIIPKKCNFGYDIIVYIGEAMFIRCRNSMEILTELHQKNISISKNEISYLARKFIAYLALAHKGIQEKTKNFMNLHGGYILHIDGTCEGASPHLISVLDGISEIVLDNIKIPTESAENIIPFLEGIKKAYGDPIALVSDMGKGILTAFENVWEDVPIFICHYHFLKDCGKDLFGKENDVIRNKLRKYGILGTLRKKVRNLKKIINSIPNLEDRFVDGVENENIHTACPIQYVPLVTTYLLIKWTLAGKDYGKGFGFPFDQPYLVFYKRLQVLDKILHRMYGTNLSGDWKDNRVYSRTRHLLNNVINDKTLKSTAAKMEEKITVFNKLRTAMRITLPESKQGLNDNGNISNIRTIEKTVKKFRDKICKEKHLCEEKEYRKMIEQIDRYWDKLFSDPIAVETNAGKIIIQPQRTNNILEQFFRDISRSHRKRSGFNSMSKTLEAMLPDTPLVKNLRNREYMNILLDGKKSLAELFSKIDAIKVQKKIRQLNNYRESTRVRKLIKNVELPKFLFSLFTKKVPDSLLKGIN